MAWVGWRTGGECREEDGEEKREGRAERQDYRIKGERERGDLLYNVWQLKIMSGKPSFVRRKKTP